MLIKRWAAVLLLFFSFNVFANTVVTDSRIKVFFYNEYEIFHLVFHYGRQAHIDFSPGENVVSISMGDQSSWYIKPVGSRLFIRPYAEGLATNMTVITNKRIYEFDLLSKKTNEQINRDLVYVVKFYYPDQTANKEIENNFVIVQPIARVVNNEDTGNTNTQIDAAKGKNAVSQDLSNNETSKNIVNAETKDNSGKPISKLSPISSSNSLVAGDIVQKTTGLSANAFVQKNSSAASPENANNVVSSADLNGNLANIQGGGGLENPVVKKIYFKKDKAPEYINKKLKEGRSYNKHILKSAAYMSNAGKDKKFDTEKYRPKGVNINKDYIVSGEEYLLPKDIFDDGALTYIKFSNDVKKITARDKIGTLKVLKYKDYFVIEKVLQDFFIIIDDKLITVNNNNYGK